MANVQNLRVYHAALQQTRDIAALTAGGGSFGDLANQLRRAAVSVVSNIAEGAGRGSDRELTRFLCIARASNLEIGAQLDILSALGRDVARLRLANTTLGCQLSAFIRGLRGGG